MNDIAKIRLKKRMSQRQMADKLGVTQQAVAKWETGKSMPRADMLPQLASILGCTVDELLRNADETKNPA